MPDETALEHWERAAEVLAAGDVAAVTAFLDDLSRTEVALVVSRLSDDQRARLLEMIGPATAASIVDQLSDVQAADILEELPAEQAAAIVVELPSASQADVLSTLDERDQAAILAEMPPSDASEARALLRHAPDTAGGIMITEYLAYRPADSVGEVARDLRDHGDEYADYEIQYIYVTDRADRLVGVLRLRDLLLSRSAAPVEAMMIRDPVRVTADTGLAEMEALFDEYGFLAVPVVDEPTGRFLGIVRRAAVQEAMKESATDDFLKASGLTGGDELRTMPIALRARRRLSWLSINIFLNVIAASVIALYQDTLAAVIALAVFLPIISDMSGCSGNQAVAVSIRELTLGLMRPDEFVRVVFKEGAVGAINGVVLGAILGTLAGLWQGNVYLGAVVGSAMALNTLIAVILGGLIPLVLRRLRFDPALASSPILTTVTDMMGFFIVLSLATAMLTRLTG